MISSMSFCTAGGRSTPSGAAATSGLRTVAGPTELWGKWKAPKAPKIDNFIPDWMIEDANKGKKDADEAYEDAVDVIEEGWEETVDLAEDGARAVKEGTKDAIEAIVDVDWAAAPEAVVEGSEEAIRGINGALPSLADLQAFLDELNVFSKIDLDALLRDVGTFHAAARPRRRSRSLVSGLVVVVRARRLRQVRARRLRVVL